MDRRHFLGQGPLGAAAVAPWAAGLVALASQAVQASPSAPTTENPLMSALPSNAYLSLLSRQDTVLLLTDHQVGLYTGVRDITVGDLKHNVVALAKAARVLEVPVVLTATMTDGMWGPVIPELLAAMPQVTPIVRSKINAWDDPRVRAAIERTGRRQLVVAGVSLEICATYPALAAKAAGYDARVVLDASGTFNEAKRTAGLARLAGAGIPVMDYASVAVEMLGDNNDPKAGEVYGALDMAFATLVWQVGHAGKA
ncbi:MAG: isochorismatase family protein [Curvibacter sp.]|nr:isochorismatase family protein [Curvibacter sp.]